MAITVNTSAYGEYPVTGNVIKSQTFKGIRINLNTGATYCPCNVYGSGSAAYKYSGDENKSYNSGGTTTNAYSGNIQAHNNFYKLNYGTVYSNPASSGQTNSLATQNVTNIGSVSTGNLIYSAKINEIISGINTLYAKRNAGGTYAQRVKNLAYAESAFNVGIVITASAVNAIISDINWLTNTCSCNCNYCTCNCNYCTCNCDYCTCNCVFY